MHMLIESYFLIISFKHFYLVFRIIFEYEQQLKNSLLCSYVYSSINDTYEIGN